MNNTPTQQQSVRIWQQNTNKSLISQLELLHAMHPNNYDIAALQEPYLDHNQRTRANLRWHVIYPSPYYNDEGNQRSTCSALLINTKLESSSWSQVDIQSWDITAVEIHNTHHTLLLINAYITPGPLTVSGSSSHIEHLSHTQSQSQSFYLETLTAITPSGMSPATTTCSPMKIWRLLSCC
jgi:hypothetical protein